MKDKINVAIFAVMLTIVLAGEVFADPGTGDGKGHTHSDLADQISVNAWDIVELRNDFEGFDFTNGIDGVDGSAGAQGLQGEKGLQGSQGLQGIAGPQGDIGLTGLQGDQGAAGLDADMTVVNNRISRNNSSAQSAQNSANFNSGRIDNLDFRLTKTQNSILKLRYDMNAGLAAAMAGAGILKAPAGMSGISIGYGVYGGEDAIAIGFSTTSGNNKHSFKFSTSHSGGEFGGAASYGYFF